MLATYKCAALCFALALAPLVSASPGSDPIPPSELVWHWHGTCQEPTLLAIEVLRNGKSLYAATFPVCQSPRAEIVADVPQRIESFTLRDPKRSILGEPLGSELEGNVWEKGGESDHVLLGISFMTSDRIWLNTFAPAFPDRAVEFSISQDIIVRTHPAKG